MSEELRELAHAIVALAESNQGIGGVLREVVAMSREQVRVLGLIHDQNATIADEMRMMNERHSSSERRHSSSEGKIRVLESSVKLHDQRFIPIEEALGLAHPAE